MLSNGNSPSHSNHLVDSVDSNKFYDASFAVEITNKMRVPEKLHVIENLSDPAIIAAKRANDQNYAPRWMHVPERIMVVG